MRPFGRSVAPLLGALALAAVSASSARAAASPIWSAPSEVAPPTPSLSVGESAHLSSVSCAAQGVCVAAGSYKPGEGAGAQPLLASQAVGSAFAATPLALPQEAEGGRLAQVSCSAAGPCVAVGWDLLHERPMPFVATLTPGSAPQATTFDLPKTSADRGALQGVSCPAAPGHCVAVGWYRDFRGLEVPIAYFQSGGIWEASVILPAAAESGELSQVACPTSESCIATGSYNTSSGTVQAFVASFDGSTWRTTTIAPPAEGSELQMSSISCPVAGRCVGAGQYVKGLHSLPVAVSQSPAGSWSAEPLPLPEGASSGRISEVDCPSEGECFAVGDLVSAGSTQPLIASHTTAWRIEAVTLPAGGPEGSLLSIACPMEGECVAAGESAAQGVFGLEAGPTQPAITVRTSGSWGPLTRLAPPQNATAAGRSGFASVACPTQSSCAVVGTYASTGTGTLAMAASSEPQLEAPALTLPKAKVGARYEQTLSVTGGVGDPTWSIIAGVLPAGLTLNPLTGTISGTPTTASTYSFAAQVSDPGPPAQQATLGLSISVARKHAAHRKRRPAISIVSSKLLAAKRAVIVSLGCLNAKCKGTLKLSARVKHVVKRRVKVSGHLSRHSHRERRGQTGRGAASAKASAHARRGHARASGSRRAHPKRTHPRYRIVRKVKHRTNVLGRAGYDMGAGRTASVTMFVTRAVIKLLKRHDNHLRAKVIATVAHGATARKKMPLRR